MSDETAGLRERRRARTRRAIQEHAMRLFLERGYDATTVSDVAQAAEVSSMTVFRYFPTKEDLVLADEYDPLMADRIASRPADQPLMRRLCEGLLLGVAELSPDDRRMLLDRLRLTLATPALRARQWDHQYATHKAIVEALRGHRQDGEQEFRLWVSVGVCLSAASAALVRWVEQDGDPDLDDLMTRALAIVASATGEDVPDAR
ncbi:helix-turn-helix domain-containing protein [Nonomuraea sp. NPDC005650]|uniref:TetR/AcrR family transcriptional regulator n=1 Tax=Nonomuraea sp. NPDC005650 TaxID=3157045 RepID=UPI0033AA00DA